MCARVVINNARRVGARAEWDRRASATEGWRANVSFVVSPSARRSKRAVPRTGKGRSVFAVFTGRRARWIGVIAAR